MKNYEYELMMMEAELNENAEELNLAKDTSRAERRQRTRRAKRRTAQAEKLKKREIAGYDADGVIKEQGKDRHWFILFPENNVIRVITKRQLPIRVRRKMEDERWITYL